MSNEQKLPGCLGILFWGEYVTGHFFGILKSPIGFDNVVFQISTLNRRDSGIPLSPFVIFLEFIFFISSPFKSQGGICTYHLGCPPAQ